MGAFRTIDLVYMMPKPLRIGSLFSGYGGLDLAVEEVFEGRTVWVTDIESGPAKILAKRFPEAPNLEDITAVDWRCVESVDIITGGSPCQDVSTAGRRSGMVEGTRSNLWEAMREAILNVKPKIVVWENVPGARSARADSVLEFCPGCMGDQKTQPNMRALGRVLSDLAEIGFDAQWRSLRASDVGFCHRRDRVFVLAWRREETSLLDNFSGVPTSGAEVNSAYLTRSSLLPTPSASLYNDSEDPKKWIARRSRLAAKHGNNGAGMPLSIAVKLLEKFSQYDEAISCQERVVGRSAPEPLDHSHEGQANLSPLFVEWMMGLPEGWVTDPNIGLTRRQQLRALGNGVVPSQAFYAIMDMLNHRKGTLVL